MTLDERKSKLETELLKARQQSNYWATRTIALDAQLALVLEMIQANGTEPLPESGD